MVESWINKSKFFKNNTIKINIKIKILWKHLDKKEVKEVNEKMLNILLNMLQEWYSNPILVWTPVVEPEVHGVERFLPEQPLDLIRKGEFYKVPIIAGFNKDEFHGFTFCKNLFSLNIF